jgi:Uma2 family endonuclease
MRALVLDPPTAGLEEVLERRRRSGLDRRDELWKGVLHMVPAPGYKHFQLDQQLAELIGPAAKAAGLVFGGEFNLGDQDDFRVPDRGLHRAEDREDWQRSAALVVEIVSPGDESWEKLPFYAAHDVDEVLIVDPEKRSVDWLGLANGEYRPIERSGLIDLGSDQLAERIDWP